MADNLRVNEGTGKLVAFDEISGVQHQRAKMEYGDDGAATDVSDLKPLPTKNYAATGTHSNTATSTSSATVLAANANRRGAVVTNDSAVVMYLKCGATASSTSFTKKMAAGDYYEIPFGYVGIIDAILASSTGTARVVEFT